MSRTWRTAGSPPLPSQDEDDDLGAPPPDDFDDDDVQPPPEFDEEDDFEPPDDEEFYDLQAPPPDDEPPNFEDEFPPDDISEEETSFPPPSDDSFAESPGKSSFRLPVSSVKIDPRTTSELVAESAKSVKTDQLSTGLLVGDTPDLLAKTLPRGQSRVSVAAPPPNDVRQETKPAYATDLPVSTASSSVPDSAAVEKAAPAKRNSLLAQGFVDAKGRFDGDPFEQLYVKVDKDAKLLTVVVETGETIPFHLTKRAYAFEDVEDPTTFILDYHHNMIIFKFESIDILMRIMKNMPEEVFMATDMLEEEKDTIDEKKSVDTAKSSKDKQPSKPTSSNPPSVPKIDHVKGTSVEDILENDFETTAERKEKIDQLFQMRESNLNASLPPPKRKKELIESYIRKPKYSVRRVALICEWVNTLRVWPRSLGILNLHREMCNGILLANIFKILKPDVEYVNMHEKAMVKKSAISNLEQVLGHIWRSKSLNNSRIPSAEEIYSGNTAKTAILLNELFSVYVLRPMYKSVLKVLKWYHGILKQYQRPLPDYIFEDGDLSGVWPHFQSGAALFCVIYHFYGATGIGKGSTTHHVNPLNIAGDPTSICDFRNNLIYVFQLLGLLEVDVLWTAEDWISNPDTEFIAFQLLLIYEHFKDKQCTLPPAHGDKPGLTSGPNGEALVIGIIFADAPANLKFLPKTRKAVRLGYDGDSMPLLPVEQSFVNPRFNAGGALPQGMISKNAKITQISVELKELKLYVERDNWNARTMVDTSKDNFEGAHVEDLLRDQQKEAQASIGPTPTTRLSPHKSGLTAKNASEPGATEFFAASTENIKSHKEISQEISVLIKALEDEMRSAKAKIKSYEEDLADRYSQLEESAQACTLSEYEIALEELDRERADLETEKKRLQDYFTRKFAFIRERKDAAQAIQQAAFAEISSASQTADQLLASSRAKTVQKKKSKKDVDPLAAEKGWVSLSAAKVDTHNFHLRNKQNVSISNFKAKITPKNILDRDRSTSKEQSFPSSSRPRGQRDREGMRTAQGSDQAPPSKDQYVEQSFEHFRQRLNDLSSRFQEARNIKTQPSIQDIVNAGPKTQRVELIALPSLEPEEDIAAMNQAHSSAVCAEEKRIMQFEDERRKIFLSERSLERSLNMSQHLFQKVAQYQPPQQPGESKNTVSMDIEEAFTFLAKPRQLQMNDRTPRLFTFVLTNTLQEPSSKQEDDYCFAFEWFEENLVSTGQTQNGYVLLDDILGVQLLGIDTSAFVINIRETPQAIKNSKGRTALVIKCGSSYDAMNYTNSLTAVVMACEGR